MEIKANDKYRGELLRSHSVARGIHLTQTQRGKIPETESRQFYEVLMYSQHVIVLCKPESIRYTSSV